MKFSYKSAKSENGSNLEGSKTALAFIEIKFSLNMVYTTKSDIQKKNQNIEFSLDKKILTDLWLAGTVRVRSILAAKYFRTVPKMNLIKGVPPRLTPPRFGYLSVTHIEYLKTRRALNKVKSLPGFHFLEMFRTVLRCVNSKHAHRACARTPVARGRVTS